MADPQSQLHHAFVSLIWGRSSNLTSLSLHRRPLGGLRDFYYLFGSLHFRSAACLIGPLRFQKSSWTHYFAHQRTLQQAAAPACFGAAFIESYFFESGESSESSYSGFGSCCSPGETTGSGTILFVAQPSNSPLATALQGKAR